MKYKKNPVDGACCACGYDGDEETHCTTIPDGTHCNHYYRGSEKDCIGDPETRDDG